ncbi:MAG: Gfo/Idh/MocA family oxidoreductase [Planctomycetes bacterium]|nr:Gfo/Idh/MocA family oxidoreductase [Planctomycetota bacterium]
MRERKTTGGVTRRDFLRAAASAVAAPYVLTSSALGAGGRAPASERIIMGAIGHGGRGRYDLGVFMWNKDVQVVAVCEVRSDRRAAAKAAVDRRYGNSDCKTYIDLREMLARPDIDAVLIATGDNWHSEAAILAARAGKDMYCEKPMSVTIAESREVAETMRRFGRIYQCGTQRRNIGNFVFAVHLARSGRLGRLRVVRAEKAWPQSGVYFTVLPPEQQPPREVMDWNQWLGPAPWRPYNHQYYARGFWSRHGDFSGGSITEWGSHTVDLCQWANDADATNPVHYEVINDKGDVKATYANGVELFIQKGLRFGSCPVRFEGDEGWVETGDSGRIECHPASLLAERKFRGGYPADDHVRQFLDCVKTRRQPVSNADVAHHSITACHCANIAVRLGRELRWDPLKEEFIGDEQANRLRSRAYRVPWRL